MSADDDSTGSGSQVNDDGTLVNVSRRKFLAGSGTLAVGLFLFGGEALADSSVVEEEAEAGESELAPEMFIQVYADGRVEFVIHRSEMGQQIWTALAQVLADEMEAGWESVEIKQAEGHPRYGDQNTDGSRSIRYNFHRFRIIGAAMRQLLERAAAKQWGVSVDACRADSGVVRNEQTGETVGFGELTETARQLQVPARSEIELKDRDDWDKIAEPVKSLITPSIIRGEGAYGQDLQVDGMKVAVIARPPDVLGRLEGYDDSAALDVPGVEETVELPEIDEPVLFKPLGGVAVVAENTWAAMKGKEALEIEWAPGPNADYNSDEFKQTLMETAREPGDVRRERGEVDKALSQADRTVEAEYYVPHVAHVAMEPPAALAEWDDDGTVMVWGCTQAPQRARSIVSEHCEVPKEDVTIQVSWLGGGFGRKSKPDYFVEAALVSRAVGAPVKVVWTREDAVRHSYYHTVSAQRLEAGLDEVGSCTAFKHRTVFPPISSTFDADATSPTWGDLRQGATDTPFDVPNFRLESGDAPAHLRTGWLRSVANIYHAFAVQSFVGELAAEANRDQKDYLLELIGPPREVDPREEGAKYDNYGSPMDEYPIDTGRLAATVERAAEMADWERDLEERHGLGIAAHRSFVTYAATVVEVAVDEEGRLSIPGAWSVLDAGTVVNPNHVRHQIEGGTIFGISNALYGEITASDGAVEQVNFPDFRVMRMNEAPRKMEVDIIESTAPPGGVGEPPTPPAAPALTNAIYDAVGLRVRELPVFGHSRRDRLPLDT
jgi:isoquinoline 1-oxidoreductase beta subunit